MTDRVVVVGGGLAGLSAALELADAGVPVTLLESRSRLGGATWSFRRNGLWFDNGQHVFLRCCTAYRSFLERIGAAGSVHLQERMELPVLAPGRGTAVLRRNRLPAPLHLAGSLLRYRHLSVGDRLRLGRALVPLRRVDLDDPALDEGTFAEFLRAHGQRPPAVERLWDLICVPTVNLPAADASLTLAATVFQIGLLSDAAAGDIGWSEVPLARLHADPAAGALERAGADIRMSTPVESVEPGAGGVVVTTATERVRAGAVIVAVPHDPAAALLPGVAGAHEWPALGTSPIVNVHLVYDRPVVPHAMAAVIDSPLQFVFDRTGTSGLGAGSGQVIAVSLSAATDWVGTGSDALVTTAERELTRLFPEAAAARRLDAVVIRERSATFRGGPGTRALRPATRSGVPGVHLAGAWTATGWPATMEGAVRSGVGAAQAVLADLSTAASTAAEEVVA